MKEKKIPVVLCNENINLAYEALSEVAIVKKFKGSRLSRDRVINSECDFLLVRSTERVNRDLLEGSDVRFVASATSGMDHFDTDYLINNNIMFYSALGCNSNSVAEYATYCTIYWSIIKELPLDSIKLGIVGFGKIGKKVAAYAHKLGIEIYVNDPPLLKSGFVFPDYVKYEDLSNLLRLSDIVTNHVNLEKKGEFPTHYLFNRKNLYNLKSGGLFMHLSRGGVVNETDLLSALEKKQSDAIVDVWENEPTFNYKLFEKAKIATPHIAGHSIQGKLLGSLMVLKELEKFSGIKPNYDRIIKELELYNNHTPIDYSNPVRLFHEIGKMRAIVQDSKKFNYYTKKFTEDIKRYFLIMRNEYPKRSEFLVPPENYIY